MRALHLKQVGDVWHYQRRRPREFEDVEPRPLIRFSLKTRDLSKARALAAQHSLELDRRWHDAKRRGVSLASSDDLQRYQSAVDAVQHLGLPVRSVDELSDAELIERLRLLVANPRSVPEQKAVLGFVEQPRLTLGAAFDRFWDHIRDEWMAVSRDQQRVKRNTYLKAIRNFEAGVGKITLYDLKREHALAFRSWWLNRIAAEGLKPYTANREINSLRRMVSVNFDIDSHGATNPFHRVRLRDTEGSQRKPFSTAFISDVLLAPSASEGLKPPLPLLVRLLVNTGLRPSEAIGLELEDFHFDEEIPHVHVRRNKTRNLKTVHSERMIPLVGVSLDAARKIVEAGGWGKWLGKNMYATTVINKYFRETELVTDPDLSLYSLRHWFQDQLIPSALKINPCMPNRAFLSR